MKITNYEIDGINPKDYPEFSDAFLSYAEDEDGKKLTEKQLEDWQKNNPDEFYEMVNQTNLINQIYL